MWPHTLEKKVSLRHGQDLRGLAGEEHAVRAHFVGVRIDFHARQRVVVDHVPLGEAAAVIHGDAVFLQAKLLTALPRSWRPCDTNVSDVECSAPPKLPNMGR